MRLRFQFTVRSILAAVVLVAVYLTLVRAIEQHIWSSFFALISLWAIALLLKVRAERSGSHVNGLLPPWPRAGPRRFVNWLGLGLISPIVIIAVGGIKGPWSVYVIEGLFGLQVIHALLGVLVLRGWRWGTLVLGIASVLFTGYIAILACMSVTGFAL